MSNIIATDLQSQEITSPLIDLFELQLPNGTTLYFHPGVEADLSTVQFRATTGAIKTYTAFPMAVDGLEVASDGAINRPNFTVANIGTNFSSQIGDYTNNDLIGQRITRRQTLKKYLVGESGDSTPPKELNRVTYVIDRIAQETNVTVTFEVSAIYDLDGIKLPRRVTIGRYCSWVYQGSEIFGKGGCVWGTDSAVKSGISPNQGVAAATVSTPTTLIDNNFYFDINNHPLVLESWLTGSYSSGAVCTTTDDTNTVTFSSAFTRGQVTDGDWVSGTGIDTGTKVLSFNSLSSIEITKNALTTGSGRTLTFIHVIPWTNTLVFNITDYARTGSNPYRYWQSQFNLHTDKEPGTTAGNAYWKEVFPFTDHDSSATYAVGDRVRKTITLENGTSLTTVWFCTAAHTNKTPSLTTQYWRREELCGKTLEACKCRFSGTAVNGSTTSAPAAVKANNVLPFGAFLGLEDY